MLFYGPHLMTSQFMIAHSINKLITTKPRTTAITKGNSNHIDTLRSKITQLNNQATEAITLEKKNNIKSTYGFYDTIEALSPDSNLIDELDYIAILYDKNSHLNEEDKVALRKKVMRLLDTPDVTQNLELVDMLEHVLKVHKCL